MSDQSDHLRQIAAVDGHGYRIGKAIDWLKTNIASPLRVEELASRVQMSTPFSTTISGSLRDEPATVSEMAAPQ